MKIITSIFTYAFSSFAKFLVVSCLAFFIGLLFLGLLFLYSVATLPKISSLADYNPPIPSEIYSNDGQLLWEPAKERRYVVPYDEIPKLIVSAFISAEDDKFFEHSGVDYFGIIRATVTNILAGRWAQGGSTITQQVAKSFLLTRHKSIIRKIKDIILAQKIEDHFSKEEILYLYLNQIYLGGGYYGVKAAAKGYFGKELKDVTIAEAALLAGLLVAPGRYSPYVNPNYAKVRQNYVLKRMFDTKRISEEEYDKAQNEVIKLKIRQEDIVKAPYFTDWIRQRVMDAYGEEMFYEGGLKITTTLDYHIQKIAEDELLKGIKELDKRQGFKGPIATIDIENDLENIERKFRDDLYKKNSNYFALDKNAVVRYEFMQEEDEFNNIKDHHILESQNFVKEYLEPGNLPSDPLLRQLKLGDIYEAVVIAVNDAQKLIYISLGGLKGVISQADFKWAHERKLSDQNEYFTPVTLPSKIVKKGDIINVKLKRISQSAYDYMDSNFIKKLVNPDLISAIKKQRFLICELDQIPEVQGAVFSILPHNGNIVTMVGGSDFKATKYNRVLQAQRQPGSAFKPFIYASGLEQGFTPSSILIDSPAALAGVDDSLNWKPRNYEGNFIGPMTYREALEHSRNVPSIKLAENLGVKTVNEYVNRMGLNNTFPHDLSFALGSFGVTLFDLVKAYAVFPNKGKIVKPKSIISILNRKGESLDISQLDFPVEKEETEVLEDENIASEEKTKTIIDENPYTKDLTKTQVYDKRLAYIMTNLLRGVIQNGTGRLAKKVSPFIGGKTGTTNNYVDALFIGFSPKIATGVWTGFDDNKTLGWPETGAKAALPIWSSIMEEALKKYGDVDFEAPEGIVNVVIDKTTGKLANNKTQNAFSEAFVLGTEPGVQEAKLKKDILIEENISSEEKLETTSQDRLDTQTEDVISVPNTSIIEDDDYFQN